MQLRPFAHAFSPAGQRQFLPTVVGALLACSLSACGAQEAGGQAPASTQSSTESGDDETIPEGVVTQASFEESHQDYTSYWHAGVAEITRYQLQQTRYGEPRSGDAVLVFVTEPFLPNAQVKHEIEDGQSDVSVLKLNAMRTFLTGIYPYSIMTSSFAPTDGTPALKVTASVTEWCGQAYAQLNRRNDGVHAELRSYFQSEGDEDTVLPNAPYEDALWQEIRRDPEALPTGTLSMIPGLHALRLYHDDLRAYAAEASLSSIEREGEQLRRYEVRYTGLGRELRVDFRADFPHVIVAFEEVHGGETTTAVRTHAIVDAYWSHHDLSHEPMRRALGL